MVEKFVCEMDGYMEATDVFILEPMKVLVCKRCLEIKINEATKNHWKWETKPVGQDPIDLEGTDDQMEILHANVETTKHRVKAAERDLHAANKAVDYAEIELSEARLLLATRKAKLRRGNETEANITEAMNRIHQAEQNLSEKRAEISAFRKEFESLRENAMKAEAGMAEVSRRMLQVSLRRFIEETNFDASIETGTSTYQPSLIKGMITNRSMSKEGKSNLS